MSERQWDRAAFVRFLVEAGALQFGSFTLKSGRVSPYFFNAAMFRGGGQLERLGDFYARAVRQAAPRATVVFGPAYKAIPLSVATAMALARQGAGDVGYLFNRKEAKGHGDRGMFVGSLPEADDRIVLVDDVFTDGGTKYEAVNLLREAFVAPIDAVVIAFHRMEQGAEGRDAVEAFTQATGIPVTALATLDDVEAELARIVSAGGMDIPGLTPHLLDELAAYRRRYGVGSA